jgi:hypothetical protein
MSSRHRCGNGFGLSAIHPFAASPSHRPKHDPFRRLPALHIAFHLIELLADTLEPSHLPAGHVSLAGFTQPLDALPVAVIEVETIGETFVYQYWDAEAFEFIVDLGLVAQRKQNLALSGCELVAFPADDVLKKTVGEPGTLEARIIQQALRERLEEGGILPDAVDIDPRCHVAGSIELSRRDATNAVHNLWEIAENKQIRRGLQDLAKQVAQAAIEFSTGQEDPHEEAPAVGAVPVLQRIMSSASGVRANRKDRICAAHAALRPGHAAVVTCAPHP